MFCWNVITDCSKWMELPPTEGTDVTVGRGHIDDGIMETRQAAFCRLCLDCKVDDLSSVSRDGRKLCSESSACTPSEIMQNTS